jgi:hypothetical protein
MIDATRPGIFFSSSCEALLPPQSESDPPVLLTEATADAPPGPSQVVMATIGVTGAHAAYILFGDSTMHGE